MSERRSKAASGAEGLLVLDKPAGMTSRTAVDRALRWFPSGTRIGHTGTLDPLATGVLVLCVGGATRLAEYVQAMSKTYRTSLRLGARSDTDDADGVLTAAHGAHAPTARAVAESLAGFVGAVAQTPPAYSAAKVRGARAYDLARSGRDVQLAARQVKIYRLDILSYSYPDLDLEVHCGKGTYIRSLARDLGERLDCGAYVRTLRRTRVGPFAVEDGVSLDADAEQARARLLPSERAVAELPALTLPAAELRRLASGQVVEWPGAATDGEDLDLAVFDEAGTLVLIAKLDRARRRLHPAKVLRV